MMNEIKKQTEEKMQKSIDSLKNELAKLRTGRAHPSLLEHLTVDYYGTETPLSHVANITIKDARTLMISPWEKNMVGAVEKAILTSDLGLNPATSSDGIRVPLPALTEERRKELVKVVKSEGENARVAIRNIRRDANQHFKDKLKDKEITEDDVRKGQDVIQKITDKAIADVDALLNSKEQELMEI